MANDSKTPFLDYKSAALPTELCRRNRARTLAHPSPKNKDRLAYRPCELNTRRAQLCRGQRRRVAALPRAKQSGNIRTALHASFLASALDAARVQRRPEAADSLFSPYGAGRTGLPQSGHATLDLRFLQSRGD